MQNDNNIDRNLDPFVSRTNYNVTSYADLQSALSSVDNPIRITVMNPFSITGAVTIAAGKDVLIESNNGSYVLMRSAPANGALFNVSAGGILHLAHVIIDGNKSDMTANRALVVNAGTLVIEEGAVLRNNDNNSSGSYSGGGINNTGQLMIRGGLIAENRTSTSGGGVNTFGGSITMSGGEISGNGASSAAGVDINTNGVFTMTGGSISGNAASAGGGGVHISGTGIFTMTGGAITGNTASIGAGIHNQGVLEIDGGAIANNTSLGGSSVGGGIYTNSASGGFTMNGGGIFGNTANRGGGVFNGDVSFIIRGGEISGNTADHGGGIYVQMNSPLSMLGGMVSDNTSYGDGGGIYIQGESASTPLITIDGLSVLIRNIAPNGNGGALYIAYSALPRLNVGANVIFAANSASQAYHISPADIPLHNTHILTHAFTAPFQFGYNNFDIRYTEGEPYAVKRTVAFNSNGGSPVPSQIVDDGTPARKPMDPTRGCDLFAGWFADPQLTVFWNFESPVTSDMTLYAKWILNPCPKPPCPPKRPCAPCVPRRCCTPTPCWPGSQPCGGGCQPCLPFGKNCCVQQPMRNACILLPARQHAADRNQVGLTTMPSFQTCKHPKR